VARIAIYTIVHDVTPKRSEITRKSFKHLRSEAGIAFDHYVADNGSLPETSRWLESEYASGRIHRLYPSDENLGQNIAANILLDWICEKSYDWILRWDNDGIPRTRRFLKSLVSKADQFDKEGVRGVFSPKITKLENPPEAFMEGDDVGFKYEVVRMLGGICRLHPASFFSDFRFNKFGALGFGEALEVADRCLELNMPKIRIPSIKVEHCMGHSKQQEEDPEYFSFENREIGRYVGYGL